MYKLCIAFARKCQTINNLLFSLRKIRTNMVILTSVGDLWEVDGKYIMVFCLAFHFALVAGLVFMIACLHEKS